uniref:Uncharacterized protein n=1 Tax=Anguilla anguilla TaxID=7936 RepID=A0A0E9X298_ANGAN
MMNARNVHGNVPTHRLRSNAIVRIFSEGGPLSAPRSHKVTVEFIFKSLHFLLPEE